MRKLLLIFFTLGLFTAHSQGQESAITPPAPEAAIFNKFIDNPVSYSTGIPQINVPIYTIELKDLSIPIALSYHAGGIKVDDIATNVGLGWKLEAGGILSATVLGELDGLNQALPLPSNPYSFDANIYSPNSSSDYQFASKVVDQQIDSKRDIYSFSFLGRSGKFYYDANGTPRTIPLSKLKIEGPGRLPNKITDEFGNQYIFGQNTSQTSEDECLRSAPRNFVSFDQMRYLTQVITARGEIVNFSYVSDGDYEYYAGVNQVDFTKKLYPISGCGPLKPLDNTCKKLISVSNTRLSSILVDGGISVIFGYSDVEREDLPGAYRLKEILINDINGSLDKKYVLNNNDYFNDDATGDPVDFKRLKLNSLVIQDGSSNEVSRYSFSYNEGLPERLSTSQDYWGFANGKNNGQNYIPSTQIADYVGANRTPDINHTVAGILTSMQLPTRGTVTYDYEANEYLYHKTEEIKVENEVVNEVVSPGNILFDTDAFSVAPGVEYLEAEFYIDGARSLIELIRPDGSKINFLPSSSSPFVEENPQAGMYDVRILNSFSSVNATLIVNTIDYQSQLVSEPRAAAGLRIQHINIDPGDGTGSIHRYFEYSEASFPGQPLFYSEHSEYEMTQEDLCYYWKLTSGNINQNALIRYNEVTELHGDVNGTGGKVVYNFLPSLWSNVGLNYPGGQVTDYSWLGERLESKETYKYDGSGSFVLVQEETNSYQINHDTDQFWEFELTGDFSDLKEHNQLGLNIRQIEPSYFKGTLFHAAVFEWEWYKLVSAWYYLDSKTVKKYDDTGLYFSSTTNYSYDNPDHIQLSRESIQKVNSPITQVTHYLYPEDYDYDGTNDFVEDLADNHIHAKPIEVINYSKDNGGNVTINNSTVTYYDEYGLVSSVYDLNNEYDIPMSSNQFKFTNRDNYSVPPAGSAADFPTSLNGYGTPRVEYLYSTDNNVIEVKKGDKYTSYLWGYNGKRVIAELNNCVYSELPSLGAWGQQLSSAQRNLLRSSLPDSQITFYDYDSMLRLTGIVDINDQLTEYIYDDFGRLHKIKDHEGYVLKQFEYNYKN
ncbi:hypothetical protein [Marinoscillum sp.]|uniref:hypothetical protein n=1 Tax=Marinoscillum sp. TaxID=2024838 RepID=UPI003BAC0C17